MGKCETAETQFLVTHLITGLISTSANETETQARKTAHRCTLNGAKKKTKKHPAVEIKKYIS